MDGVDINVDIYPHKNNDTSYDNMSECVMQHNHALEYAMTNIFIIVLN